MAQDLKPTSGGAPLEAYDIVIAGAGLAGLTQVIAVSSELGSAARLLLVDPALTRLSKDAGGAETDPDLDPNATSISRSSQNLLRAIGVWEALSPHAQPVHRIELTDTDADDRMRPTLMSYDNHMGDDHGWHAGAHIIQNAHLFRALASKLRTCPDIALAAQSVSALDRENGGLVLDLDGRQVRTQLVVAADGRRSKMRELAGIKALVRDHGQSGIRVIVAHAEPHNGIATQHFFPGGPFAMLPLVGNRTCITWTVKSAEADRLMALSNEAFLAELRRRIGGGLGELSLASARSCAPLTTRVSHALIADRFALLGDAARGVHPIAGQGLNLAFRDIAALTECICDGMAVGLDPGDREILQRYQRWRRFDGVVSSAAFDAINVAFGTGNPILRTLRDAGLGLADRIPALKRELVKEASGLSGQVPRLMRSDRA